MKLSDENRLYDEISYALLGIILALFLLALAVQMGRATMLSQAEEDQPVMMSPTVHWYVHWNGKRYIVRYAPDGYIPASATGRFERMGQAQVEASLLNAKKGIR